MSLDFNRIDQLEEENQKLKRKVEVLLSDLDNEKNALKAMAAKPVKYREENKQLKADSDHLEWVYGRLVLYGENPRVDYMVKLKEIVDRRKL